MENALRAKMAETCYFMFCLHKSIKGLEKFTKLYLGSYKHTQASPSGLTQKYITENKWNTLKHALMYLPKVESFSLGKRSTSGVSCIGWGMSQATHKAVVHKFPSFNFQVMPKMVFLTHVVIPVTILHS